MDSKKNFYFLEMNTRLQVEHPVTELITGLDLVKEQISVAAGNKLSFSQSDLKINGHALECRIYAEDPSNNFLPSTGAIIQYVPPSGPGIRVDSGFDNGSEITVHYDPLISKLICWADNRQNAIDRMHRALSEYVIGGLVTNISFLKTVIRDPSFRKGEIDINFLNDGFMSNLINMEEQKNIKEIEKVSAIFTAIIKTKSSIGSLRISQKESANNWQEQMYE
jgi:acetyl/propionyl-CoA carboxylase alpha subunit